MIVLKVGGDVFKGGLNKSLADDIKGILKKEKLILVHGGGDEVTEIAEKLGKKQTFITSPKGIRSRYTDKETVEIYTMVMAGRVNKAIVRWLLSEGLSAIGLSGIDGALMVAKRKKKLIIIDGRGRRRIIEGGFTGKIVRVNSKLLKILLESGYLPVISPVAIGEENEYLKIHFTSPECVYWGMQTWNYLMQSMDFKNYPVCLNKGKAKPNPDGSYTIYLSHRDMNVDNLVSTAGYKEAVMFFRWLLVDEMPQQPTVKLCKF